MNFTDDDLRRLKFTYRQLMPKELDSLIARLEAAEEVLKVVEQNEEALRWFIVSIRAWRKTAGK